MHCDEPAATSPRDPSAHSGFAAADSEHSSAPVHFIGTPREMIRDTLPAKDADAKSGTPTFSTPLVSPRQPEPQGAAAAPAEQLPAARKQDSRAWSTAELRGLVAEEEAQLMGHQRDPRVPSLNKVGPLVSLRRDFQACEDKVNSQLQRLQGQTERLVQMVVQPLEGKMSNIENRQPVLEWKMSELSLGFNTLRQEVSSQFQRFGDEQAALASWRVTLESELQAKLTIQVRAQVSDLVSAELALKMHQLQDIAAPSASSPPTRPVSSSPEAASQERLAEVERIAIQVFEDQFSLTMESIKNELTKINSGMVKYDDVAESVEQLRQQVETLKAQAAAKLSMESRSSAPAAELREFQELKAVAATRQELEAALEPLRRQLQEASQRVANNVPKEVDSRLEAADAATASAPRLPVTPMTDGHSEVLGSFGDMYEGSPEHTQRAYGGKPVLREEMARLQDSVGHALVTIKQLEPSVVKQADFHKLFDASWQERVKPEVATRQELEGIREDVREVKVTMKGDIGIAMEKVRQKILTEVASTSAQLTVDLDKAAAGCREELEAVEQKATDLSEAVGGLHHDLQGLRELEPVPRRDLEDVVSRLVDAAWSTEATEVKAKALTFGGEARAWRVVFSRGPTRVRSAKDFNADILGTMECGMICHGSQDGEWLVLDSEAGFIRIFGRKSGERILEPLLYDPASQQLAEGASPGGASPASPEWALSQRTDKPDRGSRLLTSVGKLGDDLRHELGAVWDALEELKSGTSSTEVQNRSQAVEDAALEGPPQQPALGQAEVAAAAAAQLQRPNALIVHQPFPQPVLPFERRPRASLQQAESEPQPSPVGQQLILEDQQQQQQQQQQEQQEQQSLQAPLGELPGVQQEQKELIEPPRPLPQRTPLPSSGDEDDAEAVDLSSQHLPPPLEGTALAAGLDLPDADLQVRPGLEVWVYQSFLSDSDEPVQLDRGQCGVINDIDEDGDLLAFFDAHEMVQWVFKSNFSKLQFFPEQPKEAVAAVSEEAVRKAGVLQQKNVISSAGLTSADCFTKADLLSRALKANKRLGDPPQAPVALDSSTGLSAPEAEATQVPNPEKAEQGCLAALPFLAHEQVALTGLAAAELAEEGTERAYVPQPSSRKTSELRAWDLVEVGADFQVEAQNDTRQLHAKQMGRVIEIDEKGNAMVQFEGMDVPQRIGRPEFGNLRLLDDEAGEVTKGCLHRSDTHQPMAEREDTCQATLHARDKPLPNGLRLQYNSVSQGRWVDCKVVSVREEDSAIKIDVKPGYWFKLDEQAQKFRPRPLEQGHVVQFSEDASGTWIETKVDAVREDGAVQLNLQGDRWLTMEEQLDKVRPYERNAFAIGDLVSVVEDTSSDSAQPVKLLRGQRGRVAFIDDEGDFLVDFDVHALSQWIAGSNASRLSLVPDSLGRAKALRDTSQNDEFSTMSVKDLRLIIDQAGMSFADCFAKKDLVSRAREAATRASGMLTARGGRTAHAESTGLPGFGLAAAAANRRKGDTVTVLQEFMSDSRESTRLKQGARGVVSNIDEEGDLLVEFADCGAHWVFAENFGKVRIVDKGSEVQAQPLADKPASEQRPASASLKVGDIIEVTNAFLSDSQERMPLQEGHQGTVKKLDEDGDVLVAFDHLKKDQWIFEAGLDKMRVVFPA